MREPAKQFIELIESQQLLAPEIVDELRRQVAESKTKLSPELLAKLLVENGHLTKFQATKLISEIKGSDDSPAGTQDDIEEELGLAPGGDEGSGTANTSTNVAEVFIDDDEVEAVEVVDVVEVEAVDEVEVAEAVEVIDSVESVEASGFDDAPRPSAKPVRPPTPKSNPWDSFRILGVAIVLALVMIAGYFLVDFFLRGNANDRLDRANEAYEARSYETAAAMYSEFTQAFPTDENVSFAKVRAALATLRKDAEGAPDPNVGLSTALEVLPGLTGEPALNEQQSDLAGALISLAGKFNDRADAAEATSDRKELMARMEQLLTLINDPQFVGTNQRNQQAPTLLRIEENRQRILREINRDEELTIALKQIDEKLSAKDTLGAYEVRKQLINRYPLVEADEALIARVKQASVILQSLVTNSELNPNLEPTAPAAGVERNFLLGNRTGDSATQMSGVVVFVKVKGSAYGIDGETGDVLWRKYIGREFTNEPLRVGEGSTADALICQPEKGLVWRVDGRTGDSKWFVDFSTPLHMPVVESQDLFVTSFDGQVASLDLESGQLKWAKKLPQPIQVSPGLSLGKPHLYLPAEHSNLYVLSRTDGSCKEVYYLGHRLGSIAVPPTLLLGQLFVFENINSTSAKIRILSTSDSGLELQDAQIPIVVDGNIMVPPQIAGRRLAVQSDLGQSLVLDVEPTLETQKVSTLASIPKSLLEPRLSWAVFNNNKLWLADTRFTRFDLQVSLGKLNGAWGKNDGDQFTGPPQIFGDVIVHTRTLRGNQGVRVAAVRSETGEAIWETDLGVPVTMINAAGPGKFDVVNSGGAYFALDAKPVRSSADSNPGQGKSSTLFRTPVKLGDSSIVLLNSSRANQFARYTSDGSKLQILSANFGQARPSCTPVAIGDKLAVGLNNGQFIMLDPTNGSVIGSPYQPPMEPGRKVRWNTPIFLPDSQTLIVSSDLQKLVRLSVGNSLRSLTEVDLEIPFTGPLALVANQVVGVVSSAAGDALALFNATSLEAGAVVPLTGRLIAGPYSIGDACILQTDSKLSAYSSDGNALWSIDFPKSTLISTPVADADNLVFATRSGEVWVVKSTTGDVVGNLDAGQPFSSQPVVLPTNRLLIGSDEGAVLALPLPTEPARER